MLLSLPELSRHSQEEVFHDVVIIGQVAVREVAGSKDDDGIETFSVVPWQRNTGDTFQGKVSELRGKQQRNLVLGWFLCLCSAPGERLALFRPSLL